MDKFELCPKFEYAFGIFGKKWNGIIIRILLKGPMRFSKIKEIVPELSDRMLTERLKQLEAEGIIKRTVYPEIPVRIEYELTTKGTELKEVMDEIQKWASKWI